MDVEGWLHSLGLEQYTRAFRDQAVDGTALADLTGDDLKALGVATVGHRRKLLEAIAQLKREAVSREADRRQLTVLCWDLVASTELNARLDPEDMSELIHHVMRAVAASVGRFKGYVAKIMGDGALVYFGYPQALEDAAERAVRAGLTIIETVRDIGEEHGIPLRTRVGIATSSVVVGDLLGEGSAQERSVVGEAPYLASRLQTLAKPNSVVVGPETHKLLGELFELDEMGPQTLKGFSNPVHAWSAVRERPHLSRFEAARLHAILPLVGREQELSLLVHHWDRACAGEGQIVLLSGEAGIGKSRLVQALREELRARPHEMVRYQCSAQHANQPFYPAVRQIWHAAGFSPGETPRARLQKLEDLAAQSQLDPTKVPYLAALLSVAVNGRHAPPELPPGVMKERTIEVLIALILGLTQTAAVLFVVEDAHWADPTTIELLSRAFHEFQGSPVLSVVTHRPTFVPPWHGDGRVTPLPLNRLARREARALIDAVTGGRTLPTDVIEQIILRTDGIPLFIEELTKTVLGSGLLTEENGHGSGAGSLPTLAIPATLQDSLMARLDRLGPAKEIAQIGAAIGRQFSYELIKSVAALPAPALRDALRHLLDSQLVSERRGVSGPVYVFKHALVQDTAYASLLRSRRRRIHAAIARALLERGTDRVGSSPEVLAHHYTEAGMIEPAVQYWLSAAEVALARSANKEGAQYADTGLTLLERLPNGSERRQVELALQVARGNAALAMKGYTTSVRWNFRSRGSLGESRR
jgi:class 3 adenylate cyclase